MHNIENLKLFEDLQSISSKYKKWQLNNTANDIIDNRKLKSLLKFEQSNNDELLEKIQFVYAQTKSELKIFDCEHTSTVFSSLNTLVFDKLELLKKFYPTIESTTTRAIFGSTLEELILINKSISNNEYKNDLKSYFHIYNEVILNAFSSFLALKEVINDEVANNMLSQAIFNQMKVIAIISMEIEVCNY